MTTKTKILIASCAILLVIIIVAIFVSFSGSKGTPSNNTSVNVPAVFTASIDTDGKTYTGSISANNSIIEKNQANISKYVVVTFNGPHDILWLACPAGYTLTNPTSSTRNAVTNIDGVGINIGIRPGVKNNIAATCSNND